jgi:two-component system sensor histidine kinase AlgZ
MTAMGWFRQWRAFLDEPLRYFWIYLAIPTLIVVGHVSWREFPLMWFSAFVMILCIGLPMHLTYLHLFERLVGGDLFSARAIPFHLVVVFGWILLGVEIGALVVSPLLPASELEACRQTIRRLSLFGAPVVAAGIIAYERYQDRLQESRMRELQAQRAALAAQVQALQTRLEPHFLFNGLNAVAGLIAEDPERAETALEKLADLLRYALEASKKRFVPLADELESVEGFLELETLRFPDRLAAAVHVEPGIGAVPVPPLLWLKMRCCTASRRAARADGSRWRSGAARASCACVSRTTDPAPAARRSAAPAWPWPTSSSDWDCSTAIGPRSASIAARSAVAA